MESAFRRRLWVILSVPLVVALCGLVPRAIVGALGVDNPWTAYLYQYAMGGLVFGVGLIVIRRSGACDFQRPGERTGSAF